MFDAPAAQRGDIEPEEGRDSSLFAIADRVFSTEVWLTPLILLRGVALFIVSTSARFALLHAEVHRLLEHPDSHVPPSDSGAQPIDPRR